MQSVWDIEFDNLLKGKKSICQIDPFKNKEIQNSFDKENLN